MESAQPLTWTDLLACLVRQKERIGYSLVGQAIYEEWFHGTKSLKI